MDKLTLKQIIDVDSSPREQRLITLQLPELIEVQYPSASSVNNYGYLSSSMYNKIKEQDEEEFFLIYHFRYHNKKSPTKVKSPPSKMENLK